MTTRQPPKQDPILAAQLDKVLIRFGGIRVQRGHSVLSTTPIGSGISNATTTSSATGANSVATTATCPLTGETIKRATPASPPIQHQATTTAAAATTTTSSHLAGLTDSERVFFTNHYNFYPDPSSEKVALLGEGGFGKAFLVRSAANFTNGETKVCKVIRKARVSQHESHIRHIGAEIAILTRVAPECPRLNKARCFFFDNENIYLVLDMTNANPKPDVATRLYSLFCRDAPHLIPVVEDTVTRWFREWEDDHLPKVREQFVKTFAVLDQLPGSVPDALDDLGSATSSVGGASSFLGGSPPSSATIASLSPATMELLAGKKQEFIENKIKRTLRHCKLGSEPAYRMDLYDYVYKSHRGTKCLPEAEAAVIIKQCLQGIDFMHRAGLVHRDLKTENVIIGVTRVATPIYKEARTVSTAPNFGGGGGGGGHDQSSSTSPTGSPCTVVEEKKEVIGVVFHDTIDAQIIDFGLVKHLGAKLQGGQAPTPTKWGFASPKIGLPTAAFMSRSSSSTVEGMIRSHASNAGSEPASKFSSPKRTTSGLSSIWNQNPLSGAASAAGSGGAGAAPAAAVDKPPGGGAWGRMPAKPAEMLTDFSQMGRGDGYVEVTPVGTDVYVALEGLLGMKGKGRDDHWLSKVEDLPKLDIFGLGAMLFFMTHGKAPFRVKRGEYPQGRTAREDRDNKLQCLIDQNTKTGPNFKPSLFGTTQHILRRMLDNDPKNRPSAAELLNDPYFAKVTERYCYTVNLDGREMARYDSTVFSRETTRETTAGANAHIPTLGESSNPPSGQFTRASTRQETLMVLKDEFGGDFPVELENEILNTAGPGGVPFDGHNDHDCEPDDHGDNHEARKGHCNDLMEAMRQAEDVEKPEDEERNSETTPPKGIRRSSGSSNSGGGPLVPPRSSPRPPTTTPPSAYLTVPKGSSGGGGPNTPPSDDSIDPNNCSSKVPERENTKEGRDE